MNFDPICMGHPSWPPGSWFEQTVIWNLHKVGYVKNLISLCWRQFWKHSTSSSLTIFPWKVAAMFLILRNIETFIKGCFVSSLINMKFAWSGSGGKKGNEMLTLTTITAKTTTACKHRWNWIRNIHFCPGELNRKLHLAKELNQNLILFLKHEYIQIWTRTTDFTVCFSLLRGLDGHDPF